MPVPAVLRVFKGSGAFLHYPVGFGVGEQMTRNPRSHPHPARAVPPFIYLGSIALGVVLHVARPISLVPRGVSPRFGALVILLAIGLFLFAVRAFRAFSLLQLGIALWVNSLAYSGIVPDTLKPRDAPIVDTPHRSRLIVNFRNAPANRSTFDEVETHEKFLLADGKDLVPPQFTLVKGTLCDREASGLNLGSCSFEARSPSLYWHIAVQIPPRREPRFPPNDIVMNLRFG
jgi:hypothetical protein